MSELQDSYLEELDGRLRAAKFNVWRNVTVEREEDLPLLAFRPIVFYGQVQSIVLVETDSFTVADLESLAFASLHFIERTQPKVTRSRLLTQYLTIFCVIADEVSDDLVSFVEQGVMPARFSTNFSFPVLVERKTGKFYYFARKRIFGFVPYVIAHFLLRKYLLVK